jgi:hypothetical protein
MPADYRLRLDDDQDRALVWPEATKRDRELSVRGREIGSALGTLVDGELLAERGDLDEQAGSVREETVELSDEADWS